MHLQRLAMPSRRVPAKISAELAIFAIGAIQARRVDSTPSQTFARGRTIRPISNNTDVQLSRQVPRSRGAFASSFILHPSSFILHPPPSSFLSSTSTKILEKCAQVVQVVHLLIGGNVASGANLS